MSRSTPTKPEPIGDRNHVLTFGKYKGQSIALVMENDGQYLAWLHHNNDYFEMTSELLEEAEGHRDDDYENQYKKSIWGTIGDTGN